MYPQYWFHLYYPIPPGKLIRAKEMQKLSEEMEHVYFFMCFFQGGEEAGLNSVYMKQIVSEADFIVQVGKFLSVYWIVFKLNWYSDDG